MRLRSLLFVPADSERKLTKALATEADALIFDLEDSVAPERKDLARGGLAEFLGSLPADRRWKVFVRINDLRSGLALSDLRAIVGATLDGVMLPKWDGPHDLAQIYHYLDMAEACADLSPGALRVLPVVTETAKAVLGLMGAGPATVTDRLVGITWGGEDLATNIGATANKRLDGAWDDPFRLARCLCLLNAAAARVGAIDTLYADFRDKDGLWLECERARRSGFKGKLAIHPDQLAIINDAFAPSAEDLEHARKVIQAFADLEGNGVASVDGRMVDRPHLVQAQRLLGLGP